MFRDDLAANCYRPIMCHFNIYLSPGAVWPVCPQCTQINDLGEMPTAPGQVMSLIGLGM